MAELSPLRMNLSPNELAPGREQALRRQADGLGKAPAGRSADAVGDAYNLGSIRGMKSGKDQLRRVSEEMESLFVKMMFSAMKKTVHKEEGMLHGGQAEEVFDDMLTEERARNFARTRSFGIADVIYKSYEKHVK